MSDAISVAREDECLTHESLIEHVRAWLDRELIDERIAIVVEGTADSAAFVILRDRAPAGARRFDRLPPRCEDRRAVVALAIAVALDAAVLDGFALHDEPEPAPPPEVDPAPVTSEPAIRVAIEFTFEAQVLVEVLPEVAVGWQLGPRIVIEEWVELGARVWITSIAGADLGMGRVDAQLVGGRVDLCLRRAIGDSIVRLRACGAAVLGTGIGTGRDVVNARSAVVGFAGLFAGAGLSVALTEWLALELEIDGWLDLWRPRFDIVDPFGRPVFSATLPVAGLLVSGGVSLRW